MRVAESNSGSGFVPARVVAQEGVRAYARHESVKGRSTGIPELRRARRCSTPRRLSRATRSRRLPPLEAGAALRPERRRAPPSAIEVARLRCRRCVGTRSSTALAQLVRQPFPRSVRPRPGGAAPREERAEPHRDPRPQLHRVHHERSRHPNARRNLLVEDGRSNLLHWWRRRPRRRRGNEINSRRTVQGPQGPQTEWRRRESNPAPYVRSKA